MKRFSERFNVTKYIIVTCDACNGYSIAKSCQKTKTCPYCGSKIILQNARKVASADSAEKATEILKKLKEKAATRDVKSTLKGYFKVSHKQ
ncbi:MAG: DUF1922 domain-containing protein [Candidatus Bathyarchaeia archaeon]